MRRISVVVVLILATIIGLPSIGAITAGNATHDGCISDDLPTSTVQASLVPHQLTIPPNGSKTIMSGEQIAIAEAIIAEGKAHDIPPGGWVVALAAALQESGLRNLNYGDRDSLGVFQQRPSAGWGTPAEITNVTLSIQAFYGVANHTSNPGLVDISRWESMSVADAAQAVQVSGAPGAYARWETSARAIVQQIAGITTEGTSELASACDNPSTPVDKCPPTGMAAEKGLTPAALLVLRCVHEKFPTITSIGGVRPDPLPAHPSGRAVDFMIPDYRTAEGNQFGWQVAQWLRANRSSLGVEYVIFDAEIWSIARDREGWRHYASVTGSTDDSSMHLNHVHVTVDPEAGNDLAPT